MEIICNLFEENKIFKWKIINVFVSIILKFLKQHKTKDKEEKAFYIELKSSCKAGI